MGKQMQSDGLQSRSDSLLISRYELLLNTRSAENVRGQMRERERETNDTVDLSQNQSFEQVVLYKLRHIHLYSFLKASKR